MFFNYAVKYRSIFFCIEEKTQYHILLILKNLTWSQNKI